MITFPLLQLINLFIGAFDDELARSALRLCVALAREPPCHRTVFMYDNRSSFHRESTLSNSMFDILTAASESSSSVHEILASRGKFTAATDQKSLQEGGTESDHPSNKKIDQVSGTGTNSSIPHIISCEKTSRSQKESETVNTVFLPRVYMHAKNDDTAKGSNELHFCSKCLGITGTAPAVVANIDVVIGNWKGLRNSDVAADERSLREIILADFVSVDSCHEHCAKCATASRKKHSERGKDSRNVPQNVSPWTKNNLCLLWRLRFLRSAGLAQGGLLDVTMYYQAVFVLCSFHTKLERLDIFSGRGSVILADLMSILDAGNSPTFPLLDNAYCVGNKVDQKLIQEKVTDSENGSSKTEYKIENGLEANSVKFDGKSTADPVVPLIAVPPDLTILACQCLIVILGRAEEISDEYKRRETDMGNRVKQMVSFEGVQRDLGLEKGQMGGRLIVLLKKVILLHAATDVPALTDHIMMRNNHSNNDNGNGSGNVKAVDEIETTATLDAQYQRLILLEQYLSLVMCCLPLKGALSTVIDNGMLSVFRTALSAPMQRPLKTDLGPSNSSHSEMKNGNEWQVFSRDLCGYSNAVLEMSLCMDSYITQVFTCVLLMMFSLSCLYHP